jgi:hypothetical protein
MSIRLGYEAEYWHYSTSIGGRGCHGSWGAGGLDGGVGVGVFVAVV